MTSFPHKNWHRRKRELRYYFTGDGSSFAIAYEWLQEALPHQFTFYGRDAWKEIRKWLPTNATDWYYTDFAHDHRGEIRIRSDKDAMLFKMTFSDILS